MAKSLIWFGTEAKSFLGELLVTLVLDLLLEVDVFLMVFVTMLTVGVMMRSWLLGLMLDGSGVVWPEVFFLVVLVVVLLNSVALKLMSNPFSP